MIFLRNIIRLGPNLRMFLASLVVILAAVALLFVIFSALDSPKEEYISVCILFGGLLLACGLAAYGNHRLHKRLKLDDEP